jgi:hypothetical protein
MSMLLCLYVIERRTTCCTHLLSEGTNGIFTESFQNQQKNLEAVLQVDIFSLGVIMYELFMMTPMVFIISNSGSDGEMLAYTHCVALGHRESLKKSWPDSVKVLLNELTNRQLVGIIFA